MIEKARKFATKAHLGQFRKFGLRPYIYHPQQVFELLIDFFYDDVNLLSAAWLHDTLEDCPLVTYNILEEEFNRDVAELVNEVSHPIVVGNRQKRWKVYLSHYEEASYYGKVLKLCDRLANLQEYIDYWKYIDGNGISFLIDVYLEESIELGESLMDANMKIADKLFKTIDQLDELCSEE